MIWGLCPTDLCPTNVIKGISVIKSDRFINNKAPDDKSRALRWSERRGSNSRHPPWQGGALPAELLSQYSNLQTTYLSDNSVFGKNSRNFSFRT